MAHIPCIRATITKQKTALEFYPTRPRTVSANTLRITGRCIRYNACADQQEQIHHTQWAFRSVHRDLSYTPSYCAETGLLSIYRKLSSLSASTFFSGHRSKSLMQTEISYQK